MTEKLALLLGVKAGDTVFIEGAESPLKIAGIAENYTYHFVYMTKATYDASFGKYAPNSILLNLSPDADSDEISSELISCDGVVSVTVSANGIGKFRKLISSLNLIVAVIVMFAGALAVVVGVELKLSAPPISSFSLIWMRKQTEFSISLYRMMPPK